jgi:hypothetical protein
MLFCLLAFEKGKVCPSKETGKSGLSGEWIQRLPAYTSKAQLM